MIEVVLDAGGQDLLLAAADDDLVCPVGRAPEKIQRQLIRFDQTALGTTAQIEEKVDMAAGVGPIIEEAIVGPAGAPSDRPLHQLAHARRVPASVGSLDLSGDTARADPLAPTLNSSRSAGACDGLEGERQRKAERPLHRRVDQREAAAMAWSFRVQS